LPPDLPDDFELPRLLPPELERDGVDFELDDDLLGGR
jgi:hypothetical protein